MDLKHICFHLILGVFFGKSMRFKGNGTKGNKGDKGNKQYIEKNFVFIVYQDSIYKELMISKSQSRNHREIYNKILQGSFPHPYSFTDIWISFERYIDLCKTIPGMIEFDNKMKSCIERKSVESGIEKYMNILGPYLYISCGIHTRLHVDGCDDCDDEGGVFFRHYDAVNIMIYSERADAYSLWYILTPDGTKKLEKYFLDIYNGTEPYPEDYLCWDPLGKFWDRQEDRRGYEEPDRDTEIQCAIMTKRFLPTLSFWPYMVNNGHLCLEDITFCEQKVNDVVVVPKGCAHCVYNPKNSLVIKIAADYDEPSGPTEPESGPQAMHVEESVEEPVEKNGEQGVRRAPRGVSWQESTEQVTQTQHGSAIKKRKRTLIDFLKE